MAAVAQSSYPQQAPRHAHDADLMQSPDAYSSEVESENDQLGEQQHGDHNAASRGRKRKRSVMVSCEICKQRKVKCDRAQPSCGWCTRNTQRCEYKERKKPGLRAGYGKELEHRLDRLEEIIQTQARLIETHIVQGNRPPANYDLSYGTRIPSYGSSSAPSAATGPSPQTSLYLPEASSIPMPHRQVEPMVSQRDKAIRSPSDTSGNMANHSHISNSMSAATPLPDGAGGDYSRNDSSLKVPVSLFSNQEQSLADPELDLPPYDLLYTLVDLYFEHINTWCPILHRRTILDTFFGPSPLEEADRVVLYAIVATTLRFSNDARLNESSRKRYHDSSKQKVLLYGLENSSVKSIQALVILALDLVGSSNGPPGWKLLALIARSVVHLGLAVEPGSSLISSAYPSIYTLRAVVLPDSETWIEDESRRRLFWMVYLLDRYATIATAFDFALDDKDIDRKLPCRDEYFTRNRPVETRWFASANDRREHAGHGQNVGSFGFYVEILGILSRIHLFLKRPVDIGALSDVEEWQTTYRKLESELTSWEFNLPTEYAHENSSRLFQSSKANKAFQCDWVMLHATYQTAVIRLHSSAAYPTTRSPIFTPSYSASQRCLMAVDSILSISRFVVDNNMLDKLGPPFAFTLWVSARLLLVHGSTIAHSVSPDIFFFVDTLAHMGRFWKVAERYSTILSRVLDEYGEYEQSAQTDDQRSTPSSVKILTDMRRCAFDLDFLISRQPRDGHGTTGLTHRQINPSASTPVGRNLAPNELEYLDVFGFFNVPRIPHPVTMLVPSDSDNGTSNNNNIGVNNDISDPMSINGLTQGPPAAASSTQPVVPATHNEFNITNYLIPTPETDWLFQPPR